MRGVAAVVLAASLLVGAAGCSASSNPSMSPSATDALPTINPSLIPTAPPASVQDVDAASFKTSYGDYIFRVGDGPTWCTISPDFGYTVCEQSEVATQYEPIPMPNSCDYSYGYQVRLWGKKPPTGNVAEFPCSGGAFSDPTGAQTLMDGQRISVAPFSCFVAGITARCQNQGGDYIVLGPQAWALSSKP